MYTGCVIMCPLLAPFDVWLLMAFPLIGLAEKERLTKFVFTKAANVSALTGTRLLCYFNGAYLSEYFVAAIELSRLFFDKQKLLRVRLSGF